MNQHGQKFKAIKHYHEFGDCHELTFSCYRQMPLLTNDIWRGLLAESVDRALVKHSLNLTAFVLMPEHVHLLVWPSEPTTANISGFLKTLKLSCSTKIKRRLVEADSPLLERLTVRERPGKKVFHFWQEGPGYDRNLNSIAAVLSAIDYIHANPLRRGLCQEPHDWLWSSNRHYMADPKFPPLAQPRWTPLPAEFLQE
jgi:putative transposase